MNEDEKGTRIKYFMTKIKEDIDNYLDDYHKDDTFVNMADFLSYMLGAAALVVVATAPTKEEAHQLISKVIEDLLKSLEKTILKENEKK